MRSPSGPRSDRPRRPDGVKHKQLHGQRVAYLSEGSGPVIVLVHGITSSSATWERVMPALAERYTVIAPDLLGHGESAKPRGDYSLGAYASGIRDLLVALGHERATFVGHSLGGGVAMQFSYQFPEFCERLVLVDSGGLGRDVSLFLRAATLPGSELVLPLLTQPQLLDAGRALGRWLNRVGLGVRTDIEEIARGHASLADREAREAFIHTLRSIIEPGGQRVSATDRLYLAENMPFLIIWGARDKVIPVEHGRVAHEQVPDSRLEVFPESGHFPQLDEPRRFVDTVTGFIESTAPSDFDPDQLRELLQHGDAGGLPGSRSRDS
jgi:pimeloyl-ACP methyl ester carboxylesterase